MDRSDNRRQGVAGAGADRLGANQDDVLSTDAGVHVPGRFEEVRRQGHQSRLARLNGNQTAFGFKDAGRLNRFYTDDTGYGEVRRPVKDVLKWTALHNT